ncbi:MAG: methylmalonyl-CoA mutase family protein [Bacteroidetes bacterium]|nr:methylmalonyl-CoA mutase family protein [Bacteroidota bacterium]
MAEHLFSEFPPVSTRQWEAVIEKDLKGGDYTKKLVWKTLEGIALRPYYRQEDLQEVKYLNTKPGDFPFVRGTKEHNHWLIHQGYCTHEGYREANRQALEGISKGVESVGFCIDGSKACTQTDMTLLLKGIDLNKTPIHFEECACSTALSYIQSFTAYVKQQNADPILVRASFDVHDFSILKDGVAAVQGFPHIRVASVDAYALHAAGATIVQELAFGLAIGSDYMNHLIDNGIKADEAANRIRFSFAVGSNYFMEVAKFRAGRLLWANAIKAYGTTDENAMKMQAHAITSPWNQTIYDPYVNMLRGTTEAMSAAIAGVDSIEVLPFDYAFHDPSVFSNRIARNTQIILKEEAHFDEVVDPAAGSYYIETLTQSIADHAWKLFKEVEDKGGYTAAFREGFIQAQIKATAQKRDANIATRRDILLGTNQFPNFVEKADTAVTPEMVTPPAATEGMAPYRGAQAFETLRYATEKSGKTPKAFMLTFGNLALCRARAQFACNFFAVAGFEVLDNNRFATIEEGVTAAQTAKAEIIVACAADDEYAAAFPKIAELLGSQGILVVAGDPECRAELEAQGITHFISVKSNVLETLKQYQTALGI